MPHFIIHCSSNVVKQVSSNEIITAINDTAVSTSLFAPENIKVRILSFDEYLAAGKKDDFIHVFGHIMEGRTVEQKANLSRQMVSKLKNMLPDVPIVSMNVSDFEKASYCNGTMV